MTLMICIDKNDGMLFCGKRLSKDKLLRERMLKNAEGARLLVNSFTAKQFEEEGVTVSEKPLEEAGKNDFIFLEDLPLPREGAERLVLYHWNRRYPADRFFDRALLEGKKRIKKTDFQGSSHEKITEEIWE